MSISKIRIGTRKSKLAIAQAIEVKKRLVAELPEFSQNDIELVKMDTTGDKIQDRHLAEIGGKGLFTREIEESLFNGDIDIAVHSMKDMPYELPDGLAIECILEREDPRDAFLSIKYKTLMDLPHGATVGTSSIRRESQILIKRPDLKIVPLRGNVITRINKLKNGDVDATFLAVAGLKRLNLADEITSAMDTNDMLPAVSQGAIGVECLSENVEILEILEKINHEKSKIRVIAERSFLKALGGSCTTPIAGLAEISENDTLTFRGLLASSDGVAIHTVKNTGKPENAEKIGKLAGEEILDMEQKTITHK